MENEIMDFSILFSFTPPQRHFPGRISDEIIYILKAASFLINIHPKVLH